MSISLSDGGLVIPSSWCESWMAENTTCTCSWANLFPVDVDNISRELDADPEKHNLSLKLDEWLEGVLLPIIATIGTIGGYSNTFKFYFNLHSLFKKVLHKF